MRGATWYTGRPGAERHISTHTPHAGRDLIARRAETADAISTHTPHAGRDIIARTVDKE